MTSPLAWHTTAEPAPTPEERAFVSHLQFARRASGLSVRQLASGMHYGPTHAWRLVNGKVISTSWSPYDAMLRALNISGYEYDQLRQLWSAIARGRKPRGEGGGAEPQSKAVAPKVVVHDGRVAISDPAVTAGRIIEIHGGHVEITTEAADVAAQIIVRGGEVTLGSIPHPREASRGGLMRFWAS